MTSYFRTQYLKEAGITEGPSLSEKISSVIEEETNINLFASAVAEVLEESYGSHNYEEFMKTLHAELGMGSLNEEETKLDTYKLTLTLSDPYEGGPGDWVDEEVKIDSSLEGDQIKPAIKNALMGSGYSRKDIYKIEDIKKIN